LGFILLFLCSSNGFAQENASKKEKKAEKKKGRIEKKADKLAKGKFMITPIAAPGYTPELGGLIRVFCIR